MIGVLFVGVFCAVGFAYACTEYMMTWFDVRHRVTAREAGLGLILAVNGLSLALMWLSAVILVAASGHNLYLQITVIALGAQAIWLCQHLWWYYREHLQAHYETSE